MKIKKVVLFLLLISSFFFYLGITRQKILLSEKENIANHYLSLSEKDTALEYLNSIEDQKLAYILLELYPYKSSLKEILNGANVRVKDGGLLHHKWSLNPEGYQRFSSHKAKKDSTKALSHLLFYLDDEGNTRFQIEKTPLKGFFGSCLHLLDYFYYLISQNQQGLTGTSKYIETSPIEK